MEVLRRSAILNPRHHFFDHCACVLVLSYARKRSVEGIRRALEGTNAEFSEEAGRRVMFLSMRSEVNPPRAQQHETAPETWNTAQLAMRITRGSPEEL